MLRALAFHSLFDQQLALSFCFHQHQVGLDPWSCGVERTIPLPALLCLPPLYFIILLREVIHQVLSPLLPTCSQLPLHVALEFTLLHACDERSSVLPAFRLRCLRAIVRVGSRAEHNRSSVRISVIQEILVDAQSRLVRSTELPLATGSDRHAHLVPLRS
jgi:hypothetical protein